jgi:flagellar assembly protein FliH
MGTAAETVARIEVFRYPPGSDAAETASWEAFSAEETGAPNKGAQAAEAQQGVPSRHAGFEQRLAEESRRSFEAGRELGRQEGRQAEREAQAAALAAAEQQRVRQAAELVQAFAAERERYLRAVEHEVVKLALAVAARILRREAQMDPLLLTGAVRVALGQLSASTQVRLRVPQGELDFWKEALAHIPNLNVKPVVEAGEGMRLGDCVVETELGSVDLGVRSQLGEIERGFFDRAGNLPSQTAEPMPAAGVAGR